MVGSYEEATYGASVVVDKFVSLLTEDWI